MADKKPDSESDDSDADYVPDGTYTYKFELIFVKYQASKLNTIKRK